MGHIVTLLSQSNGAGLGRFLQVDPVEGGTLNNYVYAVDPVNQYDLNGKWLFLLTIVAKVVKAIIDRSPPSKPKPKPPVKQPTVKPSAATGYAHWLYGGGKSQRISAKDVQWSINAKTLKKGKNKKTKVSATSKNSSQKDHIGDVRWNEGPTPRNLATAVGAYSGWYIRNGTLGVVRPQDYDMVFEGSVKVDISW